MPILHSPTLMEQGMDREFLGIRCRLIELAAACDRIDRARRSRPTTPGGCKSAAASRSSLADKPNRAERVQMAFSLP